MISGPSFGGSDRRSRKGRRCVFLLLLALQAVSVPSLALPKRLVIALDGIAYRDTVALQAGVTYKDAHGFQHYRQAFHQGYFPVSRMISTFPSTSDVAWTEIFGDRPLPGYQRTYFSEAANSQIVVNPLATTMEHESQMQCQVENSFIRTLGYLYPRHTYEYEVHNLIKTFLHDRSGNDNFYAYIRTSDDAQHLARDIFAMLGLLDEKLQQLRARYRAQEGRELEILILSDHGNNHAGVGKRVKVRAFLKKAGYRITKSIQGPKDVVLPTTGIEAWVEIHNAPVETESLLQQLWHLEGVDVLTARDPARTNRFIVMNSKGERAGIEWNPAKNAFRYSTETGDPINYLPVIAALAQKHRLDADGFAAADDWMAETVTRRYPLALERIVQGHTRVALNPATILISLNNHYVHAGWLIKKGSECVTFGGTHGALDDLNSDGILLSSFAPTRDTSASRVAALFDGFPGLRNFRAEENGAEWVSQKIEALTAVARTPFDRNCRLLPDGEVFLRIWTPSFTHLDSDAPVELTVRKARRYSPARIRRADPNLADTSEQHLILNQPMVFPENSAYERVYALPPGLVLEPQKEYRIVGRIRERNKDIRIFEFTFRTDSRGQPVAY